MPEHKWEPRHEAHAIEIVAIALAFEGLLSDTQLRKALRIADAATAETGLSERKGVPSVQIRIDGGQVVPADTTPLSGMSFRRSAMEEAVDGDTTAVVAEELVIDRQHVVFRCRRYTRWAQFYATAQKLLVPVLDGLVDSIAIRFIRLEYRDRFNYSGDAVAAPTRSLLNDKSPLIAPHVFSLSSLWHSHTGMFENIEGAKRRLIQIEIGATDQEAKSATITRSIAIKTAVQDDFELSQALEAEPQQAAQIVSRLPEMHERSKRIFGDLITSEIAQRISLLGKDDES